MHFFAHALLSVTLPSVLLQGKSRVADCLLDLVQTAAGNRLNNLDGEQTAVSLGHANLGEASGEWGRKGMTYTARREPAAAASHAIYVG